MTQLGKLKQCSYRSFGPQLQQDVFLVEFEFQKEIHEHPVLNMGWSYNNPTLMLLAYLDMKPTNIEGTRTDIGGIQVPVEWGGDEHGYLLGSEVFETGQKLLKQADWFDLEGSVYNSEGQGAGGMNVEPGTGNQGAVEIEVGGE